MQVKVLTNPRIEKHPGCVAKALSIMGNKWTALLIMELAAGPSRFSALEAALRGISPRTLSQRLDKLEQQKIITRKNYAEVPPRVEYDLTAKGRDLIPILKSMAAWGDKYH
ncbi:helix-turn-helix transcriptional regulator [Candidatus Saccharibacteria bacterium]|nr:helix-turn-helix transcriptional regulator [Candidatus Saccharibacteria bacterium]